MNSLLIKKVHDLIEKQNRPPPKKKPKDIFDGIKVAKKKKRKLIRKA
jgi:hypothetical protein